MRNKKILIIALTFLLLFSVPGFALNYLYPAEVERVIDGDTIVVDLQLGLGVVLDDQYIRFYGIDAWEVTGENKEKGADEGIDGYIYFHDEPKRKETKQVIIQVKSGHVGSGTIDALKGVIDKKNAEIGVFITLREPTKPMAVEAVSSGYYKSPLGHNYPKIQILTPKYLPQATSLDGVVREVSSEAGLSCSFN